MTLAAVQPRSILVNNQNSALSRLVGEAPTPENNTSTPVSPRAPSPALIATTASRDLMSPVAAPLSAAPAEPTALRNLRACLVRPVPWPSGEAVAQDARAIWFEDPAYQRYLDELTNSDAQSGNYTNILINGPESYARREANIREADVVMAKYYQVDNDETSKRIVEEMKNTAARGGKVFFQYDVKVSFNLWQLLGIWAGLRSPVPPVLEPLDGQENVALIPNNRPSKLHILTVRDHEKYLITWREGCPVVLLMGGMNLSNAWAHGGDPFSRNDLRIKYRDTDVEIIGPTAERAIHEFVADVAQNEPDKIYDALEVFARMNKANQQVLYPASEENAVIRFITNRPRNGDCGQLIKKLYISLLEQVPAGETVRIENAYFLPRGRLRRAFVAAADRGVKFEIVINAPGAPELESNLLGLAGHALLRRMLGCTTHPENFSFYEYRGSALAGTNCMHQKVASFGDHGPYIIGSSNLDEQSLHFNKEVVALIYDAQGRKKFDEMWERDVNGVQIDTFGNGVKTVERLTADFLNNEPAAVKLKQDTLYRLFSRIL